VVYFDGEEARGESLVVFRESLHELHQRDIFQASRDE
jgi:hypothetical protein